MGIVNGTTNYILDRMDTEGAELADVLADAQRLGYAEADPTADVEGYDAAQKAAILASLAFHTTVPLESVHREGITGIDKAMMDAARHAGLRHQAARGLRATDGQPDAGSTGVSGSEAISVRVYPALISREHPLASVHGANNAVFVQAEAAGQPDVLRRGRRRRADGLRRSRRRRLGGAPAHRRRRRRRRVDAREPADRRDRPRHDALPDHPRGGRPAGRPRDRSRGSSARDASRSRPSSRPSSGEDARTASLVIGTHKALEQDLSETVDRLAASGVVERVVSVLRVEGD